MERLPYIDEHRVSIDAPPERVWPALLQTLRHAFGRNRASTARLLRCDPVLASPSFSGAVGETLPGFRVVEAEPGRRLALAGGHRFSRYRLDVAFEDGQLRAITHAAFPGLAGRAYRAAVVDSGAHRALTRRLMHDVARRASSRGASARPAGRRLPTTAHTSRPWRIHEIAPDFRVEDVWALPTPGGPGALPRVVALVSGNGFPDGAPLLVRALWKARWKLGGVLGWDRHEDGIGTRVPSLRDRLPADLRAAPDGPDFAAVPFTSLYEREDEFAAEMANRTVHSVMHIGWVADGDGRYRGQLAVLVKPNGWFGAAYMVAIKPFRYLFVYPALMRKLAIDWPASAPM